MLSRSENRIFTQIDAIYIVLFFASFASSMLGIVFMLLLVFYLTRGAEGGVKSLLLLTTRGLMSSAVAAPLNASVKWVVLLGVSIWLIISTNIEYEDKIKLSKVNLSLCGFLLITVIGAFFNSSYPLTALFKMVSFALPFIAVIKGIAATRRYCRWIDYFSALYLILFAISAVLIPFGRFRTVNSNFQGVFNHVSILGVICAVFIAAFLESSLFKNKLLIRGSVIIAVLLMCYLSASRTGMFSAIAVLGFYYMCSRRGAKSKNAGVVLVGIIAICVWVAMGGQVQQTIFNFIWKNSVNSIFDSRWELIYLARIRYESHKLIGTGFMVPYYKGIVDWSLNFGLIVEPGNIVWMLLGDTGLAGTILFTVMFLTIMKNGSRNRLHLLVGAYLINMGEVVFFSSNNMSILVYMLIAVYLLEDERADDSNQKK